MRATLTTVPALKAYLHIAGDEHDNALAATINAVSEAIERYCGRTFGHGESEETHDGGGARLFLRRRPVAKVLWVREDGARVFGERSNIPARDYVVYPEEGTLVRMSGSFGPGLRTVRVRYRGGYRKIPPALAQAANVLAAHYYIRGRQGGDGLTSESLGTYSVSYDGADWPAAAKAILDGYRNFAAGG